MEFRKGFMSMALAMTLTSSTLGVCMPVVKAADSPVVINEVCTQNKSCLSEFHN